MQDAANGSSGARQGRDAYEGFGQLSIADIFHFIRRYFVLTSLTTCAALALAVAHILMATPLYTSAGLLLIDVRVPHLATEQWRETGGVLDGAQVESQIAIMRSEPVSIAVVKKLGLLNDPRFNPPDPSETSSEPSKGAASVAPGAAPSQAKAAQGEAAPKDDAVSVTQLREVAGRVVGGLSIQRVGFSYVLRISYTSPDPETAARLANAYMQSFIDDQIAVRADAARQGTDWLEKRINNLRLQMNEAALKVQAFKARRDYSIVGRPDVGVGAKDGSGAPTGLTETLEELEATALTYRRMFESALQVYTELDQRQSYAVSTARIIATAGVPTGKSFPKRKQAIAVALVAGLAMGFGIGLLIEGYRFARATQTRRHSEV